MKIITTLIAILGCHYISFSQTTVTVSQPLGIEKKGHVAFLVSSSNPVESLRGRCTPSSGKGEIIITGIPLSNGFYITENIELNVAGSFTFKKANELKIPFNHEVFIEDKLTGRIFNLAASDLYTFDIPEKNVNRFRLHVLKKENKETIAFVN